ncbi:MAG: S41 family peptidase [Pseudomonadales bacterium]|nr:S41 family peptidase [Pseudomonadales bacterium]
MIKKLQASDFRKVFAILFVLFLGAFGEYKFQYLAKYARTNQGAVNSGSGETQLARIMNAVTPDQREDVDFGIFWEVWSILERDYIDPEKIESSKMVDGAISGMTASLEDPYTVYLSPKDNERSGQDLAGSFYGVGIELGYIDGFLAAVAPLDGSPAELAGVKAGDFIVRVKDEAKDLDEDSSKWSLNKAVDNIRGPIDTPVTLTLVRKEVDQPIEITINRGEIIVKSATLEFVDHAGKRVAHIKLSKFGERTNGEWDSIVNEILAQKDSLDGVVLDVRNNPGGFFDGAIDIASEFIEEGTVVSQKDRLLNQNFSARGQARLKDIQLEVLINRGSASASEIVAGAVRDRLGAKLIGENSFGKGTVQDRRSLSNGGGLHVTVAKWLLPAGSWIHETGIPADIEVEDNPETPEDEQLLRAIEEI